MSNLKEVPSSKAVVAKLIAFFLTDAYQFGSSESMPLPEVLIERASVGEPRYNSVFAGTLLTTLMDPEILSSGRFFIAEEIPSDSKDWTESLRNVTAVMMFFAGSGSGVEIDRTLVWMRSDYMENEAQVKYFADEFVSITSTILVEMGKPSKNSFYFAIDARIAKALEPSFSAGKPCYLFTFCDPQSIHGVENEEWVDKKSGKEIAMCSLRPRDSDQLPSSSVVPHPNAYYKKLVSPPFADSTCGAFAKENGAMISWCITHAYDLSVGLLFTEEEWRNRGLGVRCLLQVAVKQKALYDKLLDDVLDLLSIDGETRYLLRRVLRARLVSFAFVTMDNVASQAVMRKAGFTLQPHQKFQWVVRGGM
ncbi:hypothetical protein BJ742DRAFT_836306 [Cladochytrium replicatum]|nr:hypothetical protein BJ742DRAFT_836306 [Cladochytrium replicatum]